MADDLVMALKRGLDLLVALNEPETNELRHLHAATGLPKATIVRLLRTLEGLGYVARRPGGGYQVTVKVLALSRGCNSTDHLLQVARPVLDWLRREQVWPADLAIFDSDAMVIVDTGRGPGTLSLNRTVGSRLPVMSTALGRAYLAFCGADEREQVLTRLRDSADPNDALARDGAATAAVLAAARRKGYALCDREYLRTIRGVAMPILVEGRVVACLNMMAVAQAMTMRQAERAFVPVLTTAAANIAHAYVGARLHSA